MDVESYDPIWPLRLLVLRIVYISPETPFVLILSMYDLVIWLLDTLDILLPDARTSTSVTHYSLHRLIGLKLCILASWDLLYPIQCITILVTSQCRPNVTFLRAQVSCILIKWQYKDCTIPLESSYRRKTIVPGANFGRFDGWSGASVNSNFSKNKLDTIMILLSKVLKYIILFYNGK